VRTLADPASHLFYKHVSSMQVSATTILKVEGWRLYHGDSVVNRRDRTRDSFVNAALTKESLVRSLRLTTESP
jgi:hypothetical protein